MPGHEKAKKKKKSSLRFPPSHGDLEAMSEVINSGRDGNSLLRPRAQPSELVFFRTLLPHSTEMIEKNAAHPC